ncbi:MULTISPECIES: succinylglutamate desuccinylase [unclassified Arsukibacterium]|uniref:succinylglutamate desuccinylase n=1 Tax=unclassified Arsukibacterium TaxID=2635278 RepID=UPI000C4E67B5|nr:MULTISPECIES: succinylglutamate desuccinylase [unclassified Arsukibacterium]MAA93573.1 succinylglutamate desuccinylase [Rheinheimera sp.]MBM33399.1 succinylglutamate desuccinylase [Rheinheimera sp.]|tara:strand:- start:19954 stop:21000 length:1047 start_codon:yes stop_codon:yes gene_type:complete
MAQQLIPADDFLQLTLDNPDGLAPFGFTLSNGIQVKVWDSGVISFEPAGETTEDVVLSCGVHGNETAPIEICAAIVKDILTEQLAVKVRLLVLFGNPPAINAGKREIDENLNRLFSGYHSKGAGLINAERQRAKRLEQYVSQFYQRLPVTKPVTHNRSLYDLHTAIRGSRFEKFAVYPYLHGKPWRQAEFAFLAACDVYTVLLMQTPASTFSYYAANEHGANSFTIELGKVKPFGQNDMDRFAGADTSLRALIRNEPVKSGLFDHSQFNMYQVYRSIIKQTQDFKLHFADDIENFTSYPPGTLLATDGDTEYRVEQQGEALIFPNANVAVGQRAMLMVVPCSVMDNLQ